MDFSPTLNLKLWSTLANNMRFSIAAVFAEVIFSEVFVSPHSGFFLGDGAGVGKGRQLAGIIIENWNQGRRRHLWFSVSADLMHAAKRDLVNLRTCSTPLILPLSRKILELMTFEQLD
jgi:hypothetical protein